MLSLLGILLVGGGIFTTLVMMRRSEGGAYGTPLFGLAMMVTAVGTIILVASLLVVN